MTLFYMILTRKIHDQKNTYRAKKYITPEKYMTARKSTYVLSAGFANTRRPHPHSPATPLNNHSVNQTQSPTTLSNVNSLIPSAANSLTHRFEDCGEEGGSGVDSTVTAVGKVCCDGRRCVWTSFLVGMSLKCTSGV